MTPLCTACGNGLDRSRIAFPSLLCTTTRRSEIGRGGQRNRHLERQVNSYLSRHLRYVRHEELVEGPTHFLDVVTSDPTTGISVTNHFSVYPELPVLRSTAEVHNTSKRDVTLQMVASLVFGGLTLGSEK